jgi:DNA-binding CsgD family transcriptional regulator/tetratricopeptide (TPR) repeat protein
MQAELLERQAVLGDLAAALKEAEAGRGRLALVAGEAGVGKTAVVRRFCDRVRERTDGSPLWGGCDPLFTPRPLGPFLEMASQAGEEFAAAVDAGAGPHTIVSALLGVGPNAPTRIVVIEDLHWADEASLDVVRLLARRVEGTRTLVVATYRDDELGRAHPLRLVLGEIATRPAVTRLTVAALTPEAVAVLAEPAGFDAVSLYHQTSGNPFFVTEVVAGGDGAIPPTVSDAVLARVGRLTPAARALLDAVAIAPPRVEHWLLERLVDGDGNALELCRGSGIVTAGATSVAFRHELARLAVVESIDPHRRRALHRGVLEALCHPPTGELDVVRLAHHADAAGDADAVLRYAQVAAARATSLGAHREAAAHYARLLRYSDRLDLGSRAEFLEGFSAASYLTDRCEDAIRAIGSAVELYRALGDRAKEGDALALLSSLQVCPISALAAELAGRQAVTILEQLPPGRALARAYANLATVRMNVEDADGTDYWGSQAIELAERIDDRDIIVNTLNTMGTMDGLHAGPGQVRRLEQSMVLGREEGQLLRAYSHLVWVAWRHCDYAVAERYAQRALELCREPHFDLWRLQLSAYLACLRLDRGEWDDALGWAGMALSDPRSSPLPRILGSVVVALVAARRGDADGRQHLETAWDLGATSGELQRLAPVAAARAEVAWQAGDPRTVEEATASTLALAVHRGAAWVAGRLACWRDRAGLGTDPPDGGPESVRELTDAVAEPFALELAGKYQDAAEIWRERGCPFEAAVVLGRADDEHAMRRSHDELLALGAFATADAVARRLRVRGVRALRRGPRPSTRRNAARLTARELEVVGLLSDGLTDAAIADRLFLSPRTVAHHVSSILQKVDARTRREAVAESARLGLLQS